jgi:nitroreductase
MLMVLSAKETDELKKAPSAEGVIPVILERWSPRSFTDREVSPALLHNVFEAARWAASSFNEQPWRFLVGTRGSSTYDKIYQALGEFNKKWARTAPVLILNAAKSKFDKNGKDNRVAFYDLGAAASYLALQAAALRLATHQMEAFDTEAARKAFGIPAEYTIGAAIALGYQGEPAALADDQLVQREMSPRTRKPLNEFVFTEWGVPAKL